MTEGRRLKGGLALALMLTLSPATAALASHGSDSSGSAAEASDNAAKEPVTDADLQKFASAYGRLQTVRAEYGRKIKQAEDKTEQKSLRKEGRQAMVGAIRDEGLQIAEYRRIGKRLNNNKGLRARLQGLMQQQDRKDGADSGEESG